MQKNSQQSENVNSQKVDNLLSWLIESGATGLDTIEVKPSPNCDGSLGCFTTIPRQVGDIVATIPRKCIFGLGEALKSSIAAKLQEFEKTIEPNTSILTDEFIYWIYLSQCLLETNHARRSSWKPYLQSLPSESPIISGWNDSLISVIEGTNLGVAVRAEQQLLSEQQAFINKFCAANPEVLHQDIASQILWSKGNYLSRRFVGRLAIDGEGKGQEQYGGQIGCLVPFFDLLNHKNGFKVKFEMDEMCVKYVCESNLEIGDEIFNNYCQSSNEELLFTYGFAVGNNTLDSLPLKLVTQQKPKKNKKNNKKGNKSTEPTTVATNTSVFHVRPTSNGGIPASLFAKLTGTNDIEDIFPEEIDMVLRMIVSKDNIITNAIKLLEDEIDSNVSSVQLDYISHYLQGQKSIISDATAQLNEMKAEALSKHGLNYH